jgi:DNA-binding NtrC family response regulator
MTGSPLDGPDAPRRVLVVDDEVQILKALARILRKAGHVVETTTSPRAALELLSSFAPHVVLSDFRMPEMTGAELLAEVARRYPAMRRVLLTGYADLCVCEPGLVILTKPWNDREILDQCRI